MGSRSKIVLGLALCSVVAVATTVIIQGPTARFSAAASSSLNTDLIAYWKMDEASGTRSDSEPTGTAQNLTDNNTVTSTTGKISNAGQFTASNGEFLSRADSADLSVTDIDFTFAAWVYMDSKPSEEYVLSKGSGVYYLRYAGGGTDRFQWSVNSSSVSANNFGSPSTGTWYLIIAWHEAAANQIGISVNDGTANTGSANGPSDTGDAFNMGTVADLTVVNWDGRIDEVGFWKRLLTAGERTELYASGAGKTCCPF